MKFLSRRRRIPLFILLAVLLWMLAATGLERLRVGRSVTVPGSAPASASRVDGDALFRDLETLSSPAFEGRRTGSEGSRKAQAWLRGRFEAEGIRPFQGGYDQRFSFTRTSIKGMVLPHRKAREAFPEAVNLVGYLEGRERPDEFIVLSAHYDHLGIREGQLYPGADDNASGVAALLAVARHFRAEPPAHSILFAAFDAEELGLRGSERFVASPPVPRERLKLNVNLDMVGRNGDGEIYIAGTHHHPALRPGLEAVARTRRLRVLFGHDAPFYRAGFLEDWTESSDHFPFHRAGIPFVYFGVEDHSDYHGPGDTADKVPRAFFIEVTELVIEAVRHLDRTLDG